MSKNIHNIKYKDIRKDKEVKKTKYKKITKHKSSISLYTIPPMLIAVLVLIYIIIKAP